MYFWDSILSATSLAMDAFAISMCIGATTSGARWASGLRLGLICGAFQFFMPFLGWLGGEFAASYISAFDHWIAFGLLAAVGGNMIRESWNRAETEIYDEDPTKKITLLYLALATSIDALAVGASFGISKRPVFALAAASGAITAVLCFVGIYIGRLAGCKIGKKVEAAGGLVLILIGLNILREHLL
ncbi:manganese efflux pump MntP family protein [Synergistaceae bacterium OttesenSCG-928-I11]|nr:manganese efflux pump MntP family protein [Synergistaceae bacterium OttesenSCG-928-I11]